MEALTILGAASSVISVLDVATRCIHSLRAFKQHWDDTDMTVTLLIGQISTLKAALSQISEWMSTSTGAAPQHHQLIMDLEVSLHSCRLLIAFIDDHLSSLILDHHNELMFKSRARAMLQDRGIKDCVNHLNNQTAALNLLLTALNWYMTFHAMSANVSSLQYAVDLSVIRVRSYLITTAEESSIR